MCLNCILQDLLRDTPLDHIWHAQIRQIWPIMAKYAFLVHICIFEKNWACLVLTPIFMLMLPTLCFVLLYLIFPIYYVLHFDCVFTGVDARIHVDATHIVFCILVFYFFPYILCIAF